MKIEFPHRLVEPGFQGKSPPGSGAPARFADAGHKAASEVAPPHRKWWQRWWVRVPLALIGLALSAVLVGTAFFTPSIEAGQLFLTPRFSFGTWLSELPRHLPWVLLFALCTAAILPLRALQWRLALGTDAPPFRERYHAVASGAFVHNALPGKLGDLCRSQLLARRHGIPFFKGFGSVLVCKLFEFLALIAVVGLTLLSSASGAPAGLGSAVLVAAGLFALLALVSWSAARWMEPLARRLEARGRLPRLRKMLANLGQGLTPIRSPKRSASLWLVSFGPVLASAIGYGVALSAMGVTNGLFLGGILLGAITLGQFSLGLPIGMGMYYLTASWAARALGVAPGDAASLAALTHLTTVATQILVGLISVLAYKVRLRDFLPKRAREKTAPGAVEALSAE